MKNLILVLSLITSMASQSFAEEKQNHCYGKQNVSESAPFLLMVQGSNKQINKFVKLLKKDSAIVIQSAEELESLGYYMITLTADASQILTPAVVGFDVIGAINSHILRSIELAQKKSKVQTIVDCNGSNSPFPKAGGMN
jgi:hypothetical protein